MLKDEINENTQTSDYKFVTSDISDFVNEMQTPKQEFEKSENIFDSLPEKPETEIETPANETLRANPKVAQSTAHLIVTTIDAVIPETMAFAAKQKESSFFKADPETKSELEDAFTEYIKLKGAKDLPPSVLIIVLLLVAYGTKIPAMLQMRKAAILEEQNEKLRRENEELKRKMNNE